MATAKTVKVFKFRPTGSRNQGIEKVCCTGAQFLKTPFLHISGEIYFYYLRSILAIKQYEGA